MYCCTLCKIISSINGFSILHFNLNKFSLMTQVPGPEYVPSPIGLVFSERCPSLAKVSLNHTITKGSLFVQKFRRKMAKNTVSY